MGPHEQHKHCCDGHCGPKAQKKNKIHMVLKIATVLFVINVAVYVLFHRNHNTIRLPDAVHYGSLFERELSVFADDAVEA